MEASLPSSSTEPTILVAIRTFWCLVETNACSGCFGNIFTFKYCTFDHEVIIICLISVLLSSFSFWKHISVHIRSKPSKENTVIPFFFFLLISRWRSRCFLANVKRGLCVLFNKQRLYLESLPWMSFFSPWSLSFIVESWTLTLNEASEACGASAFCSRFFYDVLDELYF